jgi:RNA recognition motif-containing protein
MDFGDIKNVHLNLDRRTGYVKVFVSQQGYALIEYREYEEAKKAISEMDGREVQGRTLKCDFAFVRGAGQSTSEQIRKSYWRLMIVVAKNVDNTIVFFLHVEFGSEIYHRNSCYRVCTSKTNDPESVTTQ